MSDSSHPPAAYEWIRKIHSDPLNVGAYCALAEVYRASGALQRADLTLQRAAELSPLSENVWRGLGALRRERGEWRAAVDAFEQATNLAPGNAATWIDYATTLIAAQDLNTAEVVRARLTGEFPLDAGSHIVAAHILKTRGRFEDAILAYRRALDFAPGHTEAIFNLVDLGAVSLSDPLHAQLAQLRSKGVLRPRERANICASLGRLHDTAHQFDRAFEFYREANEATRASLLGTRDDYDPTRSEAEANLIVRSFDADTLSHPLPPLDLGQKLIFIVGMPRSGTTLIEQILGRHSRVSTGGELPFMRAALTVLHSTRAARDAPGAVRPQESQDGELLHRLRTDYVDALMERDLDGDCVTDKLPANFAAVALIRVLFPDAVIVHVKRQAMATCWSLYSSTFDQHLGYYTSFEHLAHYYTQFYRRLMHYWHDLPRANVIEVSYERLVSEPASQCRELVAACGLEWEDACLDVQDTYQPIYTSSLVQARRPIFTSSIERWRRYQPHLVPLQEALGEG